ncbi:MAG: hypothetical protein ABSF26_05095 [Thermoguttaceae bacterium]
MSTIYLLPCRCGRTIPIEARQAGETVHCQCGLAAQVPTLREIAALERSEYPAADRPAVTWGGPQRTLLLGAALVAISLLAGLAVYSYWPVTPGEDTTTQLLRRNIDRLSPLDSLHLFQRETEIGLSPAKLASDTAREKTTMLYRVWLVLVTAGLGAGTLLLILGACRSMAQRSPQRHSRKM